MKHVVQMLSELDRFFCADSKEYRPRSRELILYPFLSR